MSTPERRTAVRPVLGAVLTLICAAQSATAAPITLHSDAHRFTIRIDGLDNPERLNRLHGLDLILTTTEGEPVAGAEMLITGRRQYSDTPLPTMPKIFAAGRPGHYRLEGLRFHMQGHWRLVFDIKVEHISDRARIDVAVN